MRWLVLLVAGACSSSSEDAEGRAVSAGTGGADDSAGAGGSAGSNLIQTGGAMDAASSGYGGSASGAGGFMPPCSALDIGLEKLPPTVMLLVDQSTSMGKPFPDAGSSDTRW